MANPTPGTRPDWVDDDLYPFESRFMDIDGSSVHYVDEGHGAPVLMLHGNPTWSFLYRHFIDGLRGDYRCIALDYPGFGLSSASPTYRFSVAEHAAIVEELVIRLDLRDLTIVMQDWGGPIGTAVAVRQTDRFKGLVLGNTWAWPVESMPARFFSYFGRSPLGPWLFGRNNLFVERLLPSGFERKTLSDAEMAMYSAPFPDERSRAPVVEMPKEITRSGLLKETAGSLTKLAHLPALIFWADKDRAFGDRERQRWEAELPHHVSHTLIGAGHYWQDDAGDEAVEATRDWLQNG